MEAWNFFRLLICITSYFHYLQALESSGYLGCFKDDVFRKVIWSSKRDFNNGALCIRICRASGHTYAATKFHNCICGLSIRGNPKHVSCEYKCPGYQNEICGGPNSISLYDIRLVDTKSSPPKQTNALITSTESINNFTEQAAYNEAAVETTTAAVQTTIRTVQTTNRSTTPNSYTRKSSEITKSSTEQVDHDTDWTHCFPAEIYTSIQAGIIGIVSVVVGVIVLIRRKMRLQQNTNAKNRLYKSSKRDLPNRTVENDDDFLNASLESDLPCPAAANTDRDHLNGLLHSDLPRSTAANADEHVYELFQSNGEGLNVVNADNEYVSEPLQSDRIVSVAVNDYVDTNYDELISQRVDEHCYFPLTT